MSITKYFILSNVLYMRTIYNNERYNNFYTSE